MIMKTISRTSNSSKGFAFRHGQRVRHIGHSFMTGIPNDMLGTVDNPKQSFLKGKGFTYVEWDNGDWRGVFTRELEKV